MAVVTVGYFCTAGHTEAGGIDAFLARFHPAIRWLPCYPARTKPGPKSPQRGLREGPKDKSGATGPTLIHEMRRILREHHRGRSCALDAVLLIDDGDCRFEGAQRRGFDAWVDELTQHVRGDTNQPRLPFFVLLAAPEVEGWFLADRNESFGHHYAATQHDVKRRLTSALGAGTFERPESFGGVELPGGGCSRKLSNEIAAAFREPPALALPAAYSKKLDGPELLRRIRPDRVEARCPHYFAPTYRQLRALGEAAAR